MECTEHKIHRTTHKADAILYSSDCEAVFSPHDILFFFLRDFIEFFCFCFCFWSLHAKRAAQIIPYVTLLDLEDFCS